MLRTPWDCGDPRPGVDLVTILYPQHEDLETSQAVAEWEHAPVKSGACAASALAGWDQWAPPAGRRRPPRGPGRHGDPDGGTACGPLPSQTSSLSPGVDSRGATAGREAHPSGEAARVRRAVAPVIGASPFDTQLNPARAAQATAEWPPTGHRRGR